MANVLFARIFFLNNVFIFARILEISLLFHQRLLWKRSSRLSSNQISLCGRIMRQVFTFLGNSLPWMRRVHEGSVLDLIIDIFIFIEWKRSAETAKKILNRFYNT